VEDRKPNTTVYFLMSSGYDIFLKPETDSVIYQNAIVFMDKFVRDATAFQLNRDIEKQLEVIKDVEKKMKGVAKDQESYQKDKAKAESKISQNIIEQGALKSEWESQKKLLETVKAKTATLDQMDALKKEVSKQEDATAKAEKKYNNSMKDDEEYKGDLNKAESKIGEAQIEMDKVKTELQNENNKLAELRAQLAAL
jgi:chromosome segregation ATPase